MRKIAEKKYQLEDPFDWSAGPVKDTRWLNSRVIQIDDTILTAEQLLRIMANREGAHTEDSGMMGLNISAPVKISLPNADDETHSRANTVRFSGLTYVQIFTYLNQYQGGMCISEVLKTT